MQERDELENLLNLQLEKAEPDRRMLKKFIIPEKTEAGCLKNSASRTEGSRKQTRLILE